MPLVYRRLQRQRLFQYDAYSLNNITAKKSEEGSVAVQCGGCDGKINITARALLACSASPWSLEQDFSHHPFVLVLQ
jgi:hypothetical protein